MDIKKATVELTCSGDGRLSFWSSWVSESGSSSLWISQRVPLMLPEDNGMEHNRHVCWTDGSVLLLCNASLSQDSSVIDDMESEKLWRLFNCLIRECSLLAILNLRFRVSKILNLFLPSVKPPSLGFRLRRSKSLKLSLPLLERVVSWWAPKSLICETLSVLCSFDSELHRLVPSWCEEFAESRATAPERSGRRRKSSPLQFSFFIISRHSWN